MLARILNRSKDLLFLPGLDRYWLLQLRGQVLCLLYHRIGDSEEAAFMADGGSPVTPIEELEREIRFLQAAGAHFMTFDDLRRGKFPGRDEFGVVVSFDDGFRDVYTRGLPVLDRLGVPGVIFQTTGMVRTLDTDTGRDDSPLLWEHELYWLAGHDRYRDELLQAVQQDGLLAASHGAGHDWVSWLRENVAPDRLEQIMGSLRSRLAYRAELERWAEILYPTVADLQAAAAHGHEFGSHGHHHYKRSTISDQVFEAELAESASRLRQWLGREATCFSYPFNSRKQGDEGICQRHFQQVATVDGQLIAKGYNPLSIPRCTWPGLQPNRMRQRRWLLTGAV